MEQLRPVPPIADATLTPDLMEGFRGFAAGLRHEPLYRPYARDYLFD